MNKQVTHLSVALGGTWQNDFSTSNITAQYKNIFDGQCDGGTSQAPQYTPANPHKQFQFIYYVLPEIGQM